jgi:dTDP-4-amino-4,6-dideoxygalactose transaminase
VFVDIEPGSYNMDPALVERKLTGRTRAIMPVHLFGRMADMAGFSRLARAKGLALIEDSAHCVEGSRDGVRPGGLSDAACFSFYATKSMTSGEGGALACNSPEAAAWYRSARHHGISKDASSRYMKTYQHWDMERMGWKYNMDDIQAALLIHQIERLDANRRRREELDNLYRRLLADVDGLDFIESPGAGETSGHHLFTVLLPPAVSRDGILRLLQERGIGCAVNYRAIHTLSYFREGFGYRPEDFPAACGIGERTITLPLYPKLTEDDVRIVCETLKDVLRRPA